MILKKDRVHSRLEIVKPGMSVVEKMGGCEASCGSCCRVNNDRAKIHSKTSCGGLLCRKIVRKRSHKIAR